MGEGDGRRRWAKEDCFPFAPSRAKPGRRACCTFRVEGPKGRGWSGEERGDGRRTSPFGPSWAMAGRYPLHVPVKGDTVLGDYRAMHPGRDSGANQVRASPATKLWWKGSNSQHFPHTTNTEQAVCQRIDFSTIFVASLESKKTWKNVSRLRIPRRGV